MSIPSDKDRVEVIGLDGKKKRIRTRLNDKQKKIYAPMSDLSGVILTRMQYTLTYLRKEQRQRG